MLRLFEHYISENYDICFLRAIVVALLDLGFIFFPPVQSVCVHQSLALDYNLFT